MVGLKYGSSNLCYAYFFIRFEITDSLIICFLHFISKYYKCLFLFSSVVCHKSLLTELVPVYAPRQMKKVHFHIVLSGVKTSASKREHTLFVFELSSFYFLYSFSGLEFACLLIYT